MGFVMAGTACGGPPALVRHAWMGCAAPVGRNRIDGEGVQQDCGSTIAEFGEVREPAAGPTSTPPVY